MKKITQNLTNLKAWQSTIFAFMFLFSLTINAQEVGQEYLGNPTINTTETSPETGSNVTAGNFSGNTNAGSWGFGQQGAYAPTSGNNGDCYSEDRMFKMFKKNGEGGVQYITQTITALPAGNYNWSYWNRWAANGGTFPTWSAEGDQTPKFVVLTDDDGDGTWTSVQDNVSTEPTDAAWYQESGTYTNDIARDVKIKFTKTGGADSSALTNLAFLWFLDNASFTYASALTETSDLSMQGVLDFSLPGKYMKGVHVKATADIADLSIYSIESYASGDRLTPSAVLPLSGSAVAGDDILFWYSNADNAANIYMNASGIFDVVVNAEVNVFNGDDPLTLSMNGTVVETYGELGVDGTGEAWEYLDTWAYKVDGAWTYGVVNCTDGSYYTWDSGCAYPLAVDQQATGASTDLVTTFSENMNVVPSGGFWYNEGEAPIERKTASNVPGSDTSAMMYTDSGEFAYSNMQVQFTSKVDMNSMNTFTVDVYVDGTTVVGTSPVNLALKLQDASEATPWTNQNVIVSEQFPADTWTTLTFTFNDAASMSRDDVDRIVVQFNGENNNDPVVAYMKNMVGSYTEPVTTDTTDVTFTVNTSTIEVGTNGMYLGGGIIGAANEHAMSDADGDGTWEVTLSLEEGVTGNYIFLNSPNDGGDWGAKENLQAQACADGLYDDRLLAPVGADDYTLQHCFGSCETDGTCGSPAEPVLMPIDHENANVVYAWSDFGGASTTVIANPDASGINTSATVAQSIKTAGSETWAGTFIVLDEQLDFSTLTSLSVDVWTPDGGELVNLKVENAADGNIFMELNQPTTVAAGWETLTYDLSGQDLSQVYNKLVLFFDFNVAGDDTAYYFDNIRLVETVVPTACGDTVVYTQVANGDFTETITAPEGQVASVTINATMEANYDSIIVTDGAGNQLNSQIDGDFVDAVYTSSDATITVNILNDGSVQNGDVTLTFACEVLPTGCGDTVVYTQVANGDFTETITAPDGQVASVTINATMEANYDSIIVTDGAGNQLNEQIDGDFVDAVYTSSDATITVNVLNDGSVQNGDVTLTFACEEAAIVGIDPGCSDFDSGTEGWTVVDANGLTSDWLLDETAEGGANGSVYSMGHGYLPNDAAYNDWLVSPAYNTTGLSVPTLSYWEHLNWSADAQAHNVYYSTDYAGDATTATWNLLTAEIGADAEDTWVQRSFALPSADNVVVSFQYNDTYGSDWNIDDVCIQEDTLSTIDATVLDMKIYPNPSNGSYVTIQTPANGVKYVEVFDITGKRLINTSLSADTLDVSSISSGMYLVKVTIEGQSKTSKLIIR